MNRAILTLYEMPQSCIKCRFCRDWDDAHARAYCAISSGYVHAKDGRYEYCELAQAPELKTEDINDSCITAEYKRGYNDALKEILGE